MRHPHTVRLDGPDGSLRITRRLSDLQFRSDIKGGFASGSFTLQRPIDKAQLDMFTDVLVFDSRTGKQVGGGRLLTPGRSNSDQGQVAKVSFIGEGLASMQDVNRPWFLIDGDVSKWQRTSRNTKKFEAGQNSAPNDDTDLEGLLFTGEDGPTLYANSYVMMTNRIAATCGREVGSLSFLHKAGITTQYWLVEGRVLTDDLLTSQTPISDQFSVSWSARRFMTCNGDFSPSGKTVAGLRWRRITTNKTGDDDDWNFVRDPYVRARIADRTRTAIADATYLQNYVYAHTAFIDWIANNCPRLDILNAYVDSGTYQFNQLSWPDGIDGVGLMDELLEIESGFMWGAYDKQPNGQWRVELRIMPTDVRYELSVKDGYDDPSPTDDLYNVVWCTWTSKSGKPYSTRVPSSGVASVPQLDAAGVTRSTVLPLGTDVGSESQATQAGLDFLTDHGVVPNGGTIEINGARRIYDRYTARYVAPWEIEPGYLARIRGVQPRPDTLNPAGGPDGSTISRIMSMDWQDMRGTAVLELDTYTLSVKRKIADLVNGRIRKPKRRSN